MSETLTQSRANSDRLLDLQSTSLIKELTGEEQREVDDLEAAGVTPENTWEGAQPPPEPEPPRWGSPYVEPTFNKEMNPQTLQLQFADAARRRRDLLLEFFFERQDKVYSEVAYLGRRGATRGWPWIHNEAERTAVVDIFLTGSSAERDRLYILPRKNRDAITVEGIGRLWASIVNPKTQSLRLLELDIDGPNHPDGFADPVGIVRTITDTLTKRGVPHYLVSSRSGRGFHVLIFCEPGTACVAGSRALRAIVSDLPLADDEKKRIERFPAKEVVKGDQPTVSLPWFVLRNPGCDAFVRFDGDYLVEYEPESLSRISPEQLQALSDSLPQADPALEVREEEWRNVVRQTWEEFKAAVCAGLTLPMLKEIYPIAGDADADGWISCRDPRSPSGDATPSAGVAFNNPDFPCGFFHSFCASAHGHASSMNIFDFLIGSQNHPEIGSFMDAATLLSDMTGVPLPEPVKLSRKPVVVVNRQFSEQEAQTWSALKTHQDLYVYGGRLSIRKDEEIQVLNKDRLRHLCAHSAEFITQHKDRSCPVNPPDALLATMLAEPSPEIRRISYISRIPVFTPSWELLYTSGYDIGEGALLDLGDLEDIEIPACPSLDDVKGAYACFFGPDGIYRDFPLSGDASKANLIAMHLTPFIRTALDSLTPCFVLNAGQVGSGKTLIPKVWSTIIEGRISQHIPFPSADDELEKKVASVAKCGGRTLIMDNLPRHIISSPKLADFLTADRLRFRLLGTNDLLDFPNQLMWVLTGNNPLLTDELARRCVSIRLAPDFHTLNTVRKFLYPDILRSAQLMRKEIVGAILTLARFWVDAGRPEWSGHSLPSFERWSQVCGGILEACRIPGFLENRDDLNAVTDSDSYEWDCFMTYWWNKYRKAGQQETEPVSSRILLDEVLLREPGILASVLDEKQLAAESASRNSTKLTWTLKRKVGSVHNGLRLTSLKLEHTSEINKFSARELFVLEKVPNLQVEPIRWERPQPSGVMPSPSHLQLLKKTAVPLN